MPLAERSEGVYFVLLIYGSCIILILVMAAGMDDEIDV